MTITVIMFLFVRGYVRGTLLTPFGKRFVSDNREAHENRALLQNPPLLSPLDTIRAGHKASRCDSFLYDYKRRLLPLHWEEKISLIFVDIIGLLSKLMTDFPLG